MKKLRLFNQDLFFIKYRSAFLKMKLLLLLVVISLNAAASVYSQVRISVNLKQVTLENALKEIEQKSSYRIIYNNEVVPFRKIVSIQADNSELSEVLDQLLKGMPVRYKILDNKVIVLTEKDQPKIESNVNGYTLSIKVTDETGQPLPGATINIEGPRVESVGTDSNGLLQMPNVDVGSYTVTISFVGYEKYVTKVNVLSNTTYNVVLKASPNSLNEVRIVGYGKETKKFQTGSSIHLTAEDIKKQPVSNVLSAIQGLTPGLDIENTSGTPGAPTTAMVRGVNTLNINNSTNPTIGSNILILIDGVPGDITTVPPSDVESIDILKDAASTAIYGARGSDGVIIITTKRGSSNGGNKVTFNAYTNFEQPTNIAKVLNTTEFRDIREQAFKNDGITPNQYNAPDLFMDSTVNTNWGKSLYHTALTQDYQVGISGGTSDINYYISGGYRDEDAIVVGDWYSRRANVRMNMDATLFKGFKVGGGFAYTNQNSNLYNSAVAAAVYYALPMIPFKNADGSTNLTLYNSYTNPNRLLTNYNQSNNGQMLGNFYFNYNILDGLSLLTNMNYQYVDSKTTSFTPTTAYSYATTGNGGNYGYGGGKTLNIEPQLNYSKSFGDHSLKLLLGGTYLTTNSYATSLITSTSTNAIDALNTLTSGTVIYQNYAETPYRFASIFGRADYRYKDRYLLEGVIRRDGSSRFGADNKFGTFYSISGGWIFSDEDFIKKIAGGDFYGKIRASYGITGNDKIGDFGYQANSATTSFSYDGNNTLYVQNLANPNLKWEQTKKLDIGIDINVLKNRISITADYYNDRTTNYLFTQSLSYVTGFNSVASNLDGLISNKGFEFTLNIVPVSVKDFKWTSNFNITTVQNKLVSLPGLNNSGVGNRYTYEVGQPIGLVWGFKYLGVNPTNGLAVFQDVDHSGSIAFDTPDEQVLGKTNPDLYGGWNNTISYKKFDFSFLTQFVSGITKQYDVYDTPGGSLNLPVSFLNLWQKPGDITDIPRAATPGTAAYNNNSLIGSSSFAYSNASYIRVKNITLGYSFGTLKALHITNLRVYTTGYNLFTITGFKGDDPEGYSNLVPMTKIYTIGINATL